MGKEKFKKGDYVIHESQIKSITSLINDKFTVQLYYIM
ncbi:hypothetical protein BD780_000995 [Clostridium tetanomorphum]|nr:hypothetical protein [Clostridium tetanomorphum]NRS83770.1 hypothetical protein [Clostridium tetanomorphum]NRZ96960.1 hypothetical protein [Clostridium tetanomorphum]SQC02193.1 Uncharacterised protein [Clostridium tetanomorphum]